VRIQPRAVLATMVAGVLAACGPAPAPDAAEPASAEAGARAAGSADIPAREAPPPSGATAARPGGVPPPPAVLQGIPRRIASPEAGTGTPPVAAGAQVEYACESGATLRIAYDGIAARVAWTGGGALVLTREKPGATGGESYAGDGHVLERRGNVVELAMPGGRKMRCMEAASSA